MEEYLLVEFGWNQRGAVGRNAHEGAHESPDLQGNHLPDSIQKRYHQENLIDNDVVVVNEEEI